MSKYSRTRKAICRISRLDYWIVSRTEFKRSAREYKTWKQSYRYFRKSILDLRNRVPQFSGRIMTDKGYLALPPCKYDEARELFTLWRLGIN